MKRLKQGFKKYYLVYENGGDKSKMIEQLCESCHEWENQEELVWDIKEDRLVCVECYREVRK